MLLDLELVQEALDDVRLSDGLDVFGAKEEWPVVVPERDLECRGACCITRGSAIGHLVRPAVHFEEAHGSCRTRENGQSGGDPHDPTRRKEKKIFLPQRAPPLVPSFPSPATYGSGVQGKSKC